MLEKCGLYCSEADVIKYVVYFTGNPENRNALTLHLCLYLGLSKLLWAF